MHGSTRPGADAIRSAPRALGARIIPLPVGRGGLQKPAIKTPVGPPKNVEWLEFPLNRRGRLQMDTICLTPHAGTGL